MMHEQKLCLQGPMAQPFIKNKIGDKVKIEVTGVLTSIGMEPDYSTGPMEAGGKHKEKKQLRVEFVIAAVNGEEPDYKHMDKGEFEKHVAKNTGRA